MANEKSHPERRENSGLLRLALAVVTLSLCGCATLPIARFEKEQGEPLILAGEQPGRLAFEPLLNRPVVVRSTYLPGLTNTIVYDRRLDYRLEKSGLLTRTSGSIIPDFRANSLFGKEDFRHDQFPGFGNMPYFVYVDYWHKPAPKELRSPAADVAELLPRTRAKLRSGDKLRIIAFGDSITAGGDASRPELIFWQRWVESLRKKYPQATVEAVNGATGGDTTQQGLQRLEQKVLSQSPDLVLIGFGMNDHNREGYGVKLSQFSENLGTMIDQIRSRTSAEIVVLSAFPPNPKWHYGSHSMAEYARATEKVAREKNCAFADVFNRWNFYSTRKKPEDLLGNNINHPNDYGHWIYFQSLQALNL